MKKHSDGIGSIDESLAGMFSLNCCNMGGAERNFRVFQF